jgi:hypothetical protein
MGWVDVNTHSVSGATGNQSGFMDSSGFVVNLASKGAAVTTVGGGGALPPWAIYGAIAGAIVLLLKGKKGAG